MGKTVLVTGGARSGKSHYAQELAIQWGGKTLFVATAEAGDEEMRQRIAEHRRTRPSNWRTIESSSRIGSRVVREVGDASTVVVDCITLLVSNIVTLYSDSAGEQVQADHAEEEVNREISALVEAIHRTNASFIIVTNEVGLGLVPVNRMTRLYRDLLGKANQVLAQNAEEVYFMIAGIPMVVKAGKGLP